MKNYYSVLLGAALLFCSACSNQQLAKKPSGGEGMEEDLRLRRQWDLERLADPRTGEIPASIREKELAFAATLPAAEDVMMQRGGSSTWNFRGPSNVGGCTRALAIDVANENNVIAGSESGGMWRSTDGGVSWTRTIPLIGF